MTNEYFCANMNVGFIGTSFVGMIGTLWGTLGQCPNQPHNMKLYYIDLVFSENEFDEEVSLLSDDSVDESEEVHINLEEDFLPSSLKPDDYVLVRYSGKRSISYYVGKIIQEFDHDDTAAV